MNQQRVMQRDVPRFSFVRGLSIADLMTFANALGGVGAILAVMSYMDDGRPAHLALAMALFPICLLMDFLDGRVARARGGGSPLGGDLDSLADAVSFGVAPAIIGFGAGLRGGWDVLLLLFFAGCAIGRLARYNATAHLLSDATGKVRAFEGVPVTGSLLVVGLLALCLGTGRIGDALPLGTLHLGPAAFHPLSLAYALVGCAMISKRLRIPKP
jgi:CDP-diacylglycerol--serine O-phosphatidyltransferase